MPRNKFKPTHGMHSTRTYKSWEAMKTRCNNPSSKSFKNYGGRGIKVCEAWLKSFQNFYADMGDRPEGTSLDRWPDKNGNYEPGNCRWASKLQQQRNTTKNLIIEFNGLRLTQSEWAAKYGIKQSTLSNRLKNGWSISDALSITPRLGFKRKPLKKRKNGQFASKFGDEVEDIPSC